MPYCPKCGDSYSLNTNKCSNCGTNLSEVVNQGKMDMKIYNFKNPVVRRMIAALIDYVIVIGFILFFIFFKRRIIPFLILQRAFVLIIPPLYFLFKDAIFGKSIGKFFMGIMVFNEKENKRGGIFESIIRNWYLVIPIVGPTIYAVIMAFQILSGKKQRIGDRAASTVVITNEEYSKLP